MTEKKKQPSPSIAFRLDDSDLSDLRDLASRLNRSQVDTVRVLVREARHILPELKTLAASHPITKAGRPRGVRNSLAKCQRPQVKR
jgi:hypothetical protein